MEDQLVGGMILRLHCMDWSALAHGRTSCRICLYKFWTFFKSHLLDRRFLCTSKFWKILLFCLRCLAALIVIDNLMCAARYIVNWGATFAIKHLLNIYVTFLKYRFDLLPIKAHYATRQESQSVEKKIWNYIQVIDK